MHCDLVAMLCDFNINNSSDPSANSNRDFFRYRSRIYESVLAEVKLLPRASRVSQRAISLRKSDHSERRLALTAGKVTGKIILQGRRQLVRTDRMRVSQKSHRLQGHPEDRQSRDGTRHDTAGCTKRNDGLIRDMFFPDTRDSHARHVKLV